MNQTMAERARATYRVLQNPPGPTIDLPIFNELASELDRLNGDLNEALKALTTLYERRDELEAALAEAIAAKEAAEQQTSEEHLRVYGEELAKLPARVAELEEQKLRDEVVLNNRLLGLCDQDRIIDEIKAENLQLVAKLAATRPHNPDG